MYIIKVKIPQAHHEIYVGEDGNLRVLLIHAKRFKTEAEAQTAVSQINELYPDDVVKVVKM